MLYNILSNNEQILMKSRIINIIKEFELPIDCNEFLAPLAKKEEITFSEFCSLFRSRTPDNTMFFQTFTSSFNIVKKISTDEQANLFPVNVIPK
jgi:hypothetical protein